MTEPAQSIRKFVSPEIVFGPQSLDYAGRYARNLGASRVFVVSDKGVGAAGWTARVQESLSREGVSSVLFDDVSPNPRDHQVMAGAARYCDSECDMIVAVGGGSPMDCAKGIGIVVSHKQSIEVFEGVDKVVEATPPLVCVPTTGGSAADVSQFAIITVPTRAVKIAIISKAIVPDVALIDPQTLTTMDPYLTACTAIDALVHAVEAYVSVAHSPMTDMHALQAIRLIVGSLQRCIEAPNDLEHRSNIMQGSMHAGLAFSNASLGAVHALAHSLGGLRDLAHGECNAILLPHVIAFNHSASPSRYAAIAEAMGLPVGGLGQQKQSQRIVDEVIRLRRSVGVDRTLSSRGVDRSAIPDLARNAHADPCMATNPRMATPRDLEAIYEEAL